MVLGWVNTTKSSPVARDQLLRQRSESKGPPQVGLGGLSAAGVDVEIGVRLLQEVAAMAGSSNLLMRSLACSSSSWFTS